VTAPRAHVLVWRFTVAPAQRVEFERRYGPGGDWARLFARSAGYLGTLLLRDGDDPHAFLTVDRWRSADDWRAFKHDFAAEYVALDAACEALTRDEERLGAFDELGDAGD
jgi:heme-degrading monooxygenase HmoA